MPFSSSKYFIEFFIDAYVAREVFAVPKRYILDGEYMSIIRDIMSDVQFLAFKTSSLMILSEVESHLEKISDSTSFSMYGIQSGGFSFPKTVEDFLIYTGLRDHYLKPLDKDDPRAKFENLTGEIKELPHKLETVRDFYSGFTKKVGGEYYIVSLPLILKLDEREFIPGFIGVNI